MSKLNSVNSNCGRTSFSIGYEHLSIKTKGVQNFQQFLTSKPPRNPELQMTGFLYQKAILLDEMLVRLLLDYSVPGSRIQK